jgi:hypothetical protein
MKLSNAVIDALVRQTLGLPAAGEIPTEHPSHAGRRAAVWLDSHAVALEQQVRQIQREQAQERGRRAPGSRQA